MFGSLRVRLPLVFLAGIVLAGLITTLISVRLFQSFARDQELAKLQREGHGIAQLYSDAINASYGNTDRLGKVNDRRPPTFAARTLERATGDKIYKVGPGIFPGQGFVGLNELPPKTVDWISGKSLTFELTPPGEHRKYLAVVNPIMLIDPHTKKQQTVAGIVVATRKTDVSARVASLVERL